MRVGITGGTGHLGGLIGSRLLEEGHEVLAFTRDPDRARDSVPAGFELAAWQPAVEPLPPARLERLDAVINLVGESMAAYWTAEKKRRLRESRITATRNLVEGWMQAKTPPGVLLSSSATGYYGDGGDRELDEDAPPGQGFLASLCVEWETATYRLTGTRVVTFRTAPPLDPTGGLLRPLVPLFKLGLGAHLGHGRQWFPWIHRDDWVNLVHLALTNPEASGPMNVVSPNPVPSRTFTRALGKALHRPVLLTAPTRLLELSSQAREMVLYSQRVIPARARELGYTWRFPEIQTALDDLLG